MDMPYENFSSGFSLDEERRKLSETGPEGRRAFFRLLRASSFLIPCKADNPTEIKIINTGGGEAFLPLFTDNDELEKWPSPRESATVLPYDKLKSIVIDKCETVSGLVINPFGNSMTLRLPQIQEIDALTAGFSFEKTNDCYEKLFIPLFVSPKQLTDRLTALFDSREGIYRAHIMLVQTHTELVPHLCLLIDFSGDKTELFPEVAKVVQPFLTKGDRFEIIKADFNSLAAAAKTCAPFYDKYGV
jgi:hypothetical protein